MSSKNSKIDTVSLIIFTLLFLFFTKSTSFDYLSNFIGKTTDNFNGYLWWINSFRFIEDKNNFPFWETSAINYPFGELWLNQFDIFYLIPKIYGLTVSLIANPIFASNSYIFVGFVVSGWQLSKLIHQISNNILLSTLISISVVCNPYFLEKIANHPNLLHFWWIPLFFALIFQNQQQLYKQIQILITLTIPLYIDPNFAPISILLFSIFLINCLYRKCSLKKILTLSLIYFVAYVPIILYVFFFGFVKFMQFSRTLDDYKGFSPGISDLFTVYNKDFLTYRIGENIQLLHLNVNSETALFPGFIFSTLLLLAVLVSVIKRISGSKQIDLYENRLIFISLTLTSAILFEFSFSLTDSLTIHSINYYLFELFPQFRVYGRFVILFYVLVSIYIALKLKYVLTRPLVNAILLGLLVIEITSFFMVKIPSINISNESLFQKISNSKLDTPMYFIDNKTEENFFGWQVVHQKKLINRNFQIGSENPLGILDSETSCVLRQLGAGFIAVNPYLDVNFPKKSVSGLKYLGQDKDSGFFLFSLLNGKKTNFVSNFEYGFWPVELRSHTGSWTKSKIAAINFSSLDGSRNASSDVINYSFTISSLVPQIVELTTGESVVKVEVNQNSRVFNGKIKVSDSILIETSKFVNPADIYQTDDTRNLGVFISRPKTDLC